MGRRAGLIDVDEHHGDVVGSAVVEALLHEAVRRSLGGSDRVEDRLHFVVADVAAESIRAEQPAVAGLGLDHGGVDLGGGVDVAEDAHQHGAARVDRGLLGRDASAVDEALHKGVVGGDLRQFAVAQAVNAGVADVGDRELVADAEKSADGGAHSGQFAVFEHRLGEKRVGGDERGLERELGVIGGLETTVDFGDAVDRDGRGDVASGVATHTVGDNKKVLARVGAVLIVGADFTDVRDGSTFA